MKSILVVGAGFAGSVVARELADSNRFHVTIIDQRNHIGGNAYDPVCSETGNRFHLYGPHIFHTNSPDIVGYLSRYTKWVAYRHSVKALVDSVGQVPLPINLETLRKLYNVNLEGEADARKFLDDLRTPVQNPGNAEEYLHNLFGVELTELFFSVYTKKMWGLELDKLPVSVVARLPIRYDENPNYFNDKFQQMPADGYHALFENLLDHENIEVFLNTPFSPDLEQGYHHCFNCMAIDEYFEYRFGDLPYRSIKFEHASEMPFEFEVPTVNFTDKGKYTRITNWKLYPGAGGGTKDKVTREIPCSYEVNNRERFYPLKSVDGAPQKAYKKYAELAAELERVTFIGRCGQYIYYDMHQVVANSLQVASKFLKR